MSETECHEVSVHGHHDVYSTVCLHWALFDPLHFSNVHVILIETCITSMS